MEGDAYRRCGPTSARRAGDVSAALGLKPHPEGGFYRETFRSERLVATPRGPRCLSTAILFLVTATAPSRFHRLASTELWFFHSGAPLELVALLPDGGSQTVLLASDVRLPAAVPRTPQAIVPPGAWQAARVAVVGQCDWSLVSCVVSPGFDFADFELGERRALQAAYPGQMELIAALT
jgi:hypothetical protein